MSQLGMHSAAKNKKPDQQCFNERVVYFSHKEDDRALGS